jgi:hemerythrin-like domain-containing protein
MADPIVLWHTEHVNFATLLDLLEAQLDHFHLGEAPDYEMMLDIMFYMTHYPDAFHHPREDLAFARISERERSTCPVIDELRVQHARLKVDGEALVRALDDIVNGGIRSREDVEVPGRAYVADFRSHMQKEDTAILPLAARLLRDRDWTAIDAAVRHIDDPLFDRTEERYAALRRKIARAGRTAHAATTQLR